MPIELIFGEFSTIPGDDRNIYRTIGDVCENSRELVKFPDQERFVVRCGPYST